MAWLSHNNSWKIRLKSPLFFQDWRILQKYNFVRILQTQDQLTQFIQLQLCHHFKVSRPPDWSIWICCQLSCSSSSRSHIRNDDVTQQQLSTYSNSVVDIEKKLKIFPWKWRKFPGNLTVKPDNDVFWRFSYICHL